MLWIKALHIIAVVTWFAGMFYLPRLFVYHSMAEDKISKDRFIVMEGKLYRGIMNPSAIAVLILGLILLSRYPLTAILEMRWLQLKLLLVLLLYGYHNWCRCILKTFAADCNTRSHVWYRVFNEAPVLVLVAVVILAVVKPF